MLLASSSLRTYRLLSSYFGLHSNHKVINEVSSSNFYMGNLIGSLGACQQIASALSVSPPVARRVDAFPRSEKDHHVGGPADASGDVTLMTDVRHTRPKSPIQVIGRLSSTSTLNMSNMCARASSRYEP
jgi:hypothetical protein